MPVFWSVDKRYRNQNKVTRSYNRNFFSKRDLQTIEFSLKVALVAKLGNAKYS